MRMSWYKVTLSGDDITAGKNTSLQDDFTTLWINAGSPRDAGMFWSPSTHDYYFSLGASEIATGLIARYLGLECTAPARSDAWTVVGPDGAKDIPFSGR
jgi:hypothetical protein